MTHAEQLRRLAEGLPSGWRIERSGLDDALVLYDGAGDPLALVYGGFDLARYLVACDPVKLVEALPP